MEDRRRGRCGSGDRAGGDVAWTGMDSVGTEDEIRSRARLYSVGHIAVSSRRLLGTIFRQLVSQN